MWVKNDKVRARARCKSEDYPWDILCSWNSVKKSFQVKTFLDEHICCRVFRNTQANRN